MALRSSGRKLSFNILSESSSVDEDDFLLYQSNMDPIDKVSGCSDNPNRKKKRNRKKKPPETYSLIPEDPITDSVFTCSDSAVQNGNAFSENRSSFVVVESVVCTVSDGTEVAECQSVFNNSCSELRQRSVSNGGGEEEIVSSSFRVEENGTVDKEVEVCSAEKQWSSESNGSIVPTVKLESAESLDWKRLMAEDPNVPFSVEIPPVKYFMDEMYRGNSLRSTTTLGSEKERERVYDTIFRLPWRCELKFCS